jgi:protein phosphatase
MGIIFAGATDIGLKRKSNQDSICLDPQHSFFAVADGMGGHNGGDIASQLSTSLMPNYLSQSSEKEDSVLMNNLIQKINSAILERAQQEPELSGMGTTISAIKFSGANLIIGNVGDSRVYMINNQHIYQLTRDHSFVQEKLNMNIYSREDAARDPQKNVLVRSVGFDAELQVDVFTYRISKNDMFIICSDGLHGKVSDADILEIVKKHVKDPSQCTKKDIEALVYALIHQANENGGQDNISVIIAVAQNQ